MYEAKPNSSLPRWLELSRDLKGRSSHCVMVHYYGRPFYIPITKDVSRALNVGMDGKPRKEPFKERGFSRELVLEKALRDIIMALYLQTRDNVLAEMEDSVKRDIMGRIDELISRPLRKELEAKATEMEARPLLTEGAAPPEPGKEGGNG